MRICVSLGRFAILGLLIALVVLLGWIGSHIAEAQSVEDPSYQFPLVLKVVDQKGGPVAGAWLQAYAVENPRIVGKRYSDSDGFIRLDIPPGVYTIVFGSVEDPSIVGSQRVESPGFVTLELPKFENLETGSIDIPGVSPQSGPSHANVLILERCQVSTNAVVKSLFPPYYSSPLLGSVGGPQQSFDLLDSMGKASTKGLVDPGLSGTSLPMPSTPRDDCEETHLSEDADFSRPLPPAPADEYTTPPELPIRSDEPATPVHRAGIFETPDQVPFDHILADGDSGQNIHSLLREEYVGLYGIQDYSRKNSTHPGSDLLAAELLTSRQPKQAPSSAEAPVDDNQLNAHQTPGSISGTVFRSNGVTPVSGASVLVFDFHARYFVENTVTNSDGTYTVTGLLPREYMLQVDATEQGLVLECYVASPLCLDPAPISVASGQDTPNINLNLDVGGAISGRVLMPDGTTPVPNASVSTFDISTGLLADAASTGTDGSYILKGALHNKWLLHKKSESCTKSQTVYLMVEEPMSTE